MIILLILNLINFILFVSCFVFPISKFKSIPITRIFEMNTGKYNSALITLNFPTTILQVLENDDILSKAIKDVNQLVYVYITIDTITNCKNSNISTNDMYDYIGDVYNRLWDDMLIKKDMTLSCFVSTNMIDSNFLDISDVLVKYNFEVIYTSTQNSIKEIPNHCKIENTYHSSTLWRQINNSRNLYFYEDIKNKQMIPTYDHIALGGTFDKLHNGHRKLLTFAIMSCKSKLTIGLTGDILLEKKVNNHLIASYQIREKEILSFISGLKPNLDINIIELQDIFGPTITDHSIEALVVSSETIPGAYKINEIRQELGMSILDILITRRSNSGTLSSTFIRSLQ